MPWVIEDVAGPEEFEQRAIAGDSVGDLRNPDFPRAVGPDERWTGRIDALNTGDETHTFRVMVDSEVKSTFDLDPGQSRTLNFSGTGPASFIIKLTRKVEEIPLWKKLLIPIGVGAGAVGLYKIAR